MSTKTKLLDLTGNLLPDSRDPGPGRSDLTSEPALPPPAKREDRLFPPVGAPANSAPRTAPGQMMQLRGQMLAVEAEKSKLRAQIEAFDGARPTKKLPSDSVVPSRWANRHPDSFVSADFQRLKQDIELAGGNVQPILVRPVAGAEPARYEILFGHRRHQACLQLRLPVLAMIEEEGGSDQDLFAAMDRENRERADLSPYEQGAMYRKALEAGLFPSNRRLAEALGVSHTWVANVLQVADLPPAVVACFASPLQIQPKHAKAIEAALEADRKGVLKRAERLRGQGASAAMTVANLVGSQGAAERRNEDLEVDGDIVGSWFRDRTGDIHLKIKEGSLRGKDAAKLADAIRHVLAKALPEP